MAQNVYIMEAANLICGDTGNNPTPGRSTHLVLDEIKLPAMEEAYVDHMPGGAPISIEVNMHFNRLESTFNLAGWNPEIMMLIAPSRRVDQTFTVNGLIREKRSGRALKATAIMQGRLGRVNPTAFRKGDKMGHEYSIRGIVHYELWMQTDPDAPSGDVSTIVQEPIYFWDFFTSEFRVGEENVNAELTRVLNLPGVAV